MNIKKFKQYGNDLVNENIKFVNYNAELANLHWLINSVYNLFDEGYLTDTLDLKEELRLEDVTDDMGEQAFESMESLQAMLNEAKLIITWIGMEKQKQKYD